VRSAGPFLGRQRDDHPAEGDRSGPRQQHQRRGLHEALRRPARQAGPPPDNAKAGQRVATPNGRLRYGRRNGRDNGTGRVPTGQTAGSAWSVRAGSAGEAKPGSGQRGAGKGVVKPRAAEHSVGQAGAGRVIDAGAMKRRPGKLSASETQPAGNEHPCDGQLSGKRRAWRLRSGAGGGSQARADRRPRRSGEQRQGTQPNKPGQADKSAPEP